MVIEMFGCKIEALENTIGKEPECEKIVENAEITPEDSGKKATWTSIFGYGHISIAHNGKTICELWESVNPDNRLSPNPIIERR